MRLGIRGWGGGIWEGVLVLGCGVVMIYSFVDVCYGVQISNGIVADDVMEYHICVLFVFGL